MNWHGLRNVRKQEGRAAEQARLLLRINKRWMGVKAMATETMIHEEQRQALAKAGRNNGSNFATALIRRAYRSIVEARSLIAARENRVAALEDLLCTDELTGLDNVHGLSFYLMRELARCRRDLSAGGLLVMIEIDNLKAISDTHGAMAADACLRMTARALKDEIRDMDVAARTGADEFTLLMPDTAKGEATDRIQQLGWRVNHLYLNWYGAAVPVLASLSLRAYGREDRMENFPGVAAAALARGNDQQRSKSNGS